MFSFFPSALGFLWSTIKANKFSSVVTGLLVIFVLLFWHQRSQLKQAQFKLIVAQQNLNAANDSVRITKAKNGQIEADKLSFLFQSISELKKANQDLAKEVAITKGKVNQIAKIGVKIIHDTIPTPLVITTERTDTSVRSDFSFDTTYSPGNFRMLKGYTNYNLKTNQSFGILSKDNIGMTFVTGIKNLDKGKPEIFIRSPYPGFEVISADGAILDPNLFSKGKTKAKLITTGINIGWTPLTYTVGDPKPFNLNVRRFGATVGININLVRLLQKK